jgi:hypothetical protein
LVLHVKQFTMRVATKNDAHLPAYDHSHLSAINACPTKGILRYSQNKKMPGAPREMPLEAGSACHEAFAALRWHQYRYVEAKNAMDKDIADENLIRASGQEIFDRVASVVSDNATERTNMINVALEALYASGFYDDPSDKRRTITNLSESLIIYVDRWDNNRYPIWRESRLLGIEIGFDTVVDITDSKGEHHQFRYIGLLDGLHHDKGNIAPHENKTGIRIDEHWLSQWQLSHQITGYCLAAATVTKQDCYRAHVIGMRIPPGREPDTAVRREIVRRNYDMYIDWANWALHSYLVEQEYGDSPAEAPMYTHTCNEFFRTCSYLPYCGSDQEEREKIFEEMETDEWSPLNSADEH